MNNGADSFAQNPERQGFASPQEELEFLREQVARREQELLEKKETPIREGVIKEQVDAYRERPAAEVLHQDLHIPEKMQEGIALELAPEEHDTKMSELLTLLHEKGVMNALSVVEKMGNPHIQDDFERLLVQYIKAGFPVEGLKEASPLFRGLHMTLYEVSLPESDPTARERQLKELISGMEQFYAGMLSVSGESSASEYFTIELAVENHSDDFVFYSAVPDSKKNLFEKQILSIFHNAKIREHKDDYNIFNEKGVSVGSYASFAAKAIYPLKTYEQFDHDPLNVLLNSFSKIDRDGEGAAVQIVFSPAKDDDYLKKYKKALSAIQGGTPVKEAIDFPETVGAQLFSFAKFVSKEFKGPEKKKEEDEKKPPVVDTIAVEQITAKVGSPIVRANIRLIASSHTEGGAREILSHVESAFNQFENTHGNKVVFEHVKGSGLDKLLREFTFRLYSDDERMPMNIKELSTIMHFPTGTMKSAPQLKVAKAGASAAPTDLPQQGVLLGVNRFRTGETKVFMTPEDRLRHMYVIGQTGTGKTTLLKNMIVQDILNGEGVCMIDPHGSDVQDILAAIPKERYEDVVYFDPGSVARPMGLNMLEYDVRFPEQKTFVVNEMLSIFNKLFDMKTSGGPMFEQYFRNATMLVIEDPETGNTLLDISRVLANKAFRELKLSRCKNPLVVQFWKDIAEKAGGESSLANMVPYITSKFDNFLSNEIMRPIISQEKSSFNFREIMDNKKILLVNLAKGRLGDLNSYLIGLILIGKILMAALSRVDSLGQNLPPFYLYVDEFQNVTTDSIATILSEARKYKLSLNIAHQFIGQLEDKIKDAVFGNVGSLAVFRVGTEDAEFLQKQFEPIFTAKDLINLDNRNAYLKLLVSGRPVKPFNIETLPPPKGNPAVVEKLKELSALKFGRDRADVEADMMKKYQK
jgi:hypothetical protein